MSYAQERRGQKQRQEVVARALKHFDTGMRGAGITRSYRKTLKDRITQAQQPMRLAKSLVKELATAQAKIVEPEPERTDFSDRTEQLARTYRKIAPDMQEAAERAIAMPLPARYSPHFKPTYNPDATFEPIPPFLDRRQPKLKAAA